MALANWFRPQAARFRPALDALDDRLVPAQVSLTVTSLGDAGPGTLRAAILAADAGKPSDKFAIGFGVTGTIDLQTPLPDLTNTVAVLGPGADKLTVEPAPGVTLAGFMLAVPDGGSAALSGLTLANGTAPGVRDGVGDRGDLSVSKCVLLSREGGFSLFAGPSSANTGSLSVSGCTFVGNHCSDGIDSTSGLTLAGCTFNGAGVGVGGGTLAANGTTFAGSGLSVYASFPSTVRGCTFQGGGGISNYGALLAVSDSTFTGNTSWIGGAVSNFSAMTVARCTFAGNRATGFDFAGTHYPGRGGAIYNSGALDVRDSKFDGNSAELGGAIYNEVTYGSPTRGQVAVSGSTFTGNTATVAGGGLYNAGDAAVRESTLSGNVAPAGGGIYNAATGVLTLADSTDTGNAAPLGADLYNLGSVSVDDSTVGVRLDA